MPASESPPILLSEYKNVQNEPIPAPAGWPSQTLFRADLCYSEHHPQSDFEGATRHWPTEGVCRPKKAKIRKTNPFSHRVRIPRGFRTTEADLFQSPLLRVGLGVCFVACSFVGQDPCDPDNMRQVPRNLTYCYSTISNENAVSNDSRTTPARPTRVDCRPQKQPASVMLSAVEA